jgi:chromosome segregation protein
MLAGVAVTGTLDEAIALRERGAAAGLTLVTLEGELLTPHGAVVAGKGRGILTLKRQMRELTEEVERHKRTLEAGQKELVSLDHALAAREQEAAAMETRRNEAERALSILRVEAEKNTEEAERANRKQAHLKIEIDQIGQERQNIGAQIESRDAKALEIEQRKTSVEQAIIALQEEITGIRAAFEAHRAESVEFQLKLTQATERLGSLEGEGKAIERLLSELTDKDGTIAREVKGTEERIETLAREGQERENASRALALEAEGVTRKITTVRDDLTARVEALREQERGLRGRRLEVDEASERLHALDVSRAEHTLRLENLVTNIRTTYEVELVSYEAEVPTDEDRAALPEIREKIEKMGPVSLGSIEEYEEIKQRYDFNLGHQQDLEKSIAELEEAISRINATTRKKLREAFEALKAKFAEVFHGLFGGGRAELVLTDESNILETGIDVIAQPPGKRLQNISLLSGGEKTLTALALLFAGFLIKPTPLCILDEADAALDESNTQKFADLIKKLSHDVQFIVVTHNRVTMERADYIYGITMEEPGCSKAISLEIATA